MQSMEILAPAGGPEQLTAAVRAGADAVYLGLDSFNARRAAANFTAQSLPEVVGYCRARGVRVYVALNILLLDSELDAAAALIRQIANGGADALIVQDLAAAALARQICPELPLHASTQMSVHNAAGVQMLERLGFARVILARELSAAEIAQIHEQSPLELELFVHGALCMSVSGQCLMSAMLGGRSGNRGLCAQPCRLAYVAGGREHALSLKDLSLIPHIGELPALGVRSLKIEGRMKRPEYVAAAVHACRTALAGCAPDMNALRAVFSRSGFTDGYYAAKRTPDMFGYRTKEDVLSAKPVLGELAELYRRERPRVGLVMRFTATDGVPCSLEANDGAHSVRVQGPVPEHAQSRAMDRPYVAQSLQKCGDTPFFLDRLDTRIDDGLFLPVSALNRLRVQALEALTALRARPPARACRPLPPADYPLSDPNRRPTLRVSLAKLDQLTPALQAAAERILLPLGAVPADAAWLHALGDKLVVRVPDLIFGDPRPVAEQLRRLRAAGLTRAHTGGIGSILLAQQAGMAVSGGSGLNITNTRSLDAYRSLGIVEADLSVELTLAQARAVAPVVPRGVTAYGHLPLMSFRACPMRGASGCGDCTGETAIRDRKGVDFPLRCEGRQYSRLYNALPVYMGDRLDQLRGLEYYTLSFTVEPPALCDRILAAFQAGSAPDFPYTRGLFYRGVQ